MPHWSVEDYEDKNGFDPVANFIRSLMPAERGRIATRIKVLEEHGLAAREEYIKKIRGKIYELRMPKSTHNPRILFFAVVGRRIVLLHGFAKVGRPNDKVPEREIAIAEKRMNEFLDREGKR